MKFIITRTSGRGDNTEGPVAGAVKLNPWDWTIEVAGLEELLALAAKEKSDLVIRKTLTFNGDIEGLTPYTIEIYDDYRE